MAGRGRPRNFDRDTALEQAMEVFWAKGYESTSISDLTTAMNMKPPSLYAAFGDKEALFEEVIKRYNNQYGARIWGDVERFDHPKDATQHVLTTTACLYTQDDTPHGCMVVLAAPQAESNHLKVNKSLRDIRRLSVGNLKNLYAKAQSNGLIPQSANIENMANYYTTVQYGMSIQARDGATRDELIAIAYAAMATWPSLINT
jgi:AcrR family transcriptional regulator